jgi:hypothetical protein
MAESEKLETNLDDDVRQMSLNSTESSELDLDPKKLEKKLAKAAAKAAKEAGKAERVRTVRRSRMYMNSSKHKHAHVTDLPDLIFVCKAVCSY